MKDQILTSVISAFCVAAWAGCASKTPYATLSEKVSALANVPGRYKLQPLPAPYPYLAVGDVIFQTETPETDGARTVYVDSFEVVTSPQKSIARYNHPDLPGVSKCLLENFQDGIGDIGEEKIVVTLNGKTLTSMGGGYRNAAFDAGAKVLREKSQALEFTILLRYQRPEIVEFDRMLAEVQSASYEPLKRGCSGPASDNNFVQLRHTIESNLKQAQKSSGAAKKLYIIDAIVWSESLTAKIVDDRNIEVGGNAKAELAALATGAIGTPKAEVKFVDSSKNSALIERTRTHWAYRAVPLKVDAATGTLVVDRNAQQLILSPVYTKAATRS